jgi:mannose-6-phosphate isomerase-like protein (cupin superfamily)
LRVQAGENDMEVRAGAGVFVRSGTPHTYWNTGPERVRYLLIMSSNKFGLIQDIRALKDRTPSALREVFQKHDSELVEPAE